jgi:hypothetical protein
MKQIYTEFRITHKTQEDKEEYEQKLNEALKQNGYSGKVDWIKEKYRELIKSSK